MNSHQRRVAFRRLKRDWPVGLLVTHWYDRGEWVIVGYTRHLMTIDVALPSGDKRFPFGYCLKPRQMQRVPSKLFLVDLVEGAHV
jgi:hypothetical protein